MAANADVVRKTKASWSEGKNQLGRVRMKVIPDVSGNSLIGSIRENVSE